MRPGPAPWPFGGAGAPRGRGRPLALWRRWGAAPASPARSPPSPAFGRATVRAPPPPKPPRLRRGFAPSKPGPRDRPPGPNIHS